VKITLLFKTKIKKTQINTDEVYNTIQEGLKEMESKGIDRITVALGETEKNPNASGWIEMNQSNYYDYELLDSDEQKMVDEKKTYAVMALVIENPFNAVKYNGKGMENFTRTRVFPLLPTLKPKSNLYYVVSGGFLTGEDLKQYVSEVVKANEDWTPENLKNVLNQNMQEYQEKTKQALRDHTGLQYRLEKMEERKHSPQEEILNTIKEQIYKKN